MYRHTFKPHDKSNREREEREESGSKRVRGQAAKWAATSQLASNEAAPIGAFWQVHMQRGMRELAHKFGKE